MAQRQANGWRSYWYWPVVSLLICALLRYFFLSVYWVGQSPLPNSIPDGSWCLFLRGQSPSRGRIVLYHGSMSSPMLARVLAIPGDTLGMRKGCLLLNGQSYPLITDREEDLQHILVMEEYYCLTTAEPTDTLALSDLVIVPREQLQARLLFHLPLPL